MSVKIFSPSIHYVMLIIVDFYASFAYKANNFLDVFPVLSRVRKRNIINILLFTGG